MCGDNGDSLNSLVEHCWRIPFAFYEMIFLFIAQIVVIAAIKLDKSCAGFSGKTQFLYSVAFAIRYFNLITWDSSPLPLCIVKTVHYILIFFTSYLILDVYKNTYKNDTFQDKLLFFICVVLALFVNTGFDFWHVLWTISIYLEAVAVLPQTHLLSKTRRTVPAMTFYVSFLGMYKIIHFTSVAFMYSSTSKYAMTDKLDMAASFLQLILYMDYMWRDWKLEYGENKKDGIFVMHLRKDKMIDDVRELEEPCLQNLSEREEKYRY